MGANPLPMRNGWTEESFLRFWTRMLEIFGKPWNEKNGVEPNASWRASLVGLTMFQAADVIEHYRKSGDAQPPNLSQVMSTARQFRPSPAYVALPAPGTDESKMPENIGAMRAAIHAGQRRNPFLPGESLLDYRLALKASGKPKAEFDAERMALRGWTQRDEDLARDRMRMCGVRA